MVHEDDLDAYLYPDWDWKTDLCGLEIFPQVTEAICDIQLQETILRPSTQGDSGEMKKAEALKILDSENAIKKKANSSKLQFKFECPLCKKKFTQKCALDSHERTHTGAKPFLCEFKDCNKSFSQKTNLINHRRKHIGSRPYVCSVTGCEKSFSTNQNLRRHVKAHAGLREYRCDICFKAFGQNSNLNTHRKVFNH